MKQGKWHLIVAVFIYKSLCVLLIFIYCSLEKKTMAKFWISLWITLLTLKWVSPSLKCCSPNRVVTFKASKLNKCQGCYLQTFLIRNIIIIFKKIGKMKVASRKICCCKSLLKFEVIWGIRSLKLFTILSVTRKKY